MLPPISVSLTQNPSNDKLEKSETPTRTAMSVLEQEAAEEETE